MKYEEPIGAWHKKINPDSPSGLEYYQNEGGGRYFTEKEINGITSTILFEKMVNNQIISDLQKGNAPRSIFSTSDYSMWTPEERQTYGQYLNETRTMHDKMLRLGIPYDRIIKKIERVNNPLLEILKRRNPGLFPKSI